MKNKTWLIVVALIAVIGVLTYFLIQARKAASVRQGQIIALTDKATIFENAAGQWQTEAMGMKKSYEEVYAELQKAKAELVKKGVDVKNLRTLVKSNVVIRDTFQVQDIVTIMDVQDQYVHDTTYMGFTYEDEWAKITSRQNMFWYTVEYEVRDSVSYIIKEKHNPFKGTTLSLTGVSSNPNTRIEGLSLLELRPNPKRFVVGPQAGYGFNGKNFTPYLGVGITYKLLEF